MGTRPGTSVFGLISLAFLALSGCSTATKPETTSVSSPPRSAVEKPAAVGEKPLRTARESAVPSSLEALRRGEAPATPASSPMKEVYFDFDRYDLRADARTTLKANGEWLKANPAIRVQIEGHADERGTNEYNLALGANRAQSSKDYLLSLGISEGRLTTMSYGEEVPVCKERSEGCWQKNRRARFVIIPAQPAYSSSPATFQAAAK